MTTVITTSITIITNEINFIFLQHIIIMMMVAVLVVVLFFMFQHGCHLFEC